MSAYFYARTGLSRRYIDHTAHQLNPMYLLDEEAHIALLQCEHSFSRYLIGVFFTGDRNRLP